MLSRVSRMYLQLRIQPEPLQTEGHLINASGDEDSEDMMTVHLLEQTTTEEDPLLHTELHTEEENLTERDLHFPGAVTGPNTENEQEEPEASPNVAGVVLVIVSTAVFTLAEHYFGLCTAAGVKTSHLLLFRSVYAFTLNLGAMGCLAFVKSYELAEPQQSQIVSTAFVGARALLKNNVHPTILVFAVQLTTILYLLPFNLKFLYETASSESDVSYSLDAWQAAIGHVICHTSATYLLCFALKLEKASIVQVLLSVAIPFSLLLDYAMFGRVPFTSQAAGVGTHDLPSTSFRLRRSNKSAKRSAISRLQMEQDSLLTGGHLINASGDEDSEDMMTVHLEQITTEEDPLLHTEPSHLHTEEDNLTERDLHFPGAVTGPDSNTEHQQEPEAPYTITGVVLVVMGAVLATGALHITSGRGSFNCSRCGSTGGHDLFGE
ncbi:hypothetical protein Bbelb_305200 [Branchiostoma belcheri]|nr:hypothetical protein Bbelb_305200 [Branchiostoma belcheri]